VSNIKETAQGLTADLTLAGSACNVYGNDISDLTLTVEYQTPERLNVQIVPRDISPSNQSQYILPEFLSGYPKGDGTTTSNSSNLNFTYTNDPTFQFQVSRSGSGDVLFSTYGKKIVFEDQFLELATSMPSDYNLYGLAENIHPFRLGTNYTQTFYAVDAGNPIDSNMYGTHPMYLETRYSNGSDSSSHGVYGRNAHGQEWLLRSDNITYRTIGGSFNFYFMSGPTPKAVISQYQAGIIGVPAMQMYWPLGFHQCRWGYENWTVLQEVVDNYAAAGIQLETIWTDIDCKQTMGFVAPLS
jgi:alpha-glucosidase